MAELTLTQIGILVAVLLIGAFFGWAFRSSRSKREKISINEGWQAQIDSQQSEHDRLAKQNQSLMEQIGQYQASNKDSKMRARELSDALKEAFTRRDDLQRQLKEIRSNLEIAVVQRDKFKSDVDSSTVRDDAVADSLKGKDAIISKLQNDLANWQERVPPLVERYRQRDLEAQQLEIELRTAKDRCAALEELPLGEHTRIEPLDSSTLPDGMDASNEPHNDTVLDSVSELSDQIDDQVTNENVTAIEQTDQVVEQDENDAGNEQPVDDIDPVQNTEAESAATSSSVDNEEFPNIINDDYSAGAPTQDDLKEIKGIGPAIEATLKGLGICRFNQIAEMSEYDIDRVAQQLKGFRSRIYREDWIGQARLLQYQKNTDDQSS